MDLLKLWVATLSELESVGEVEHFVGTAILDKGLIYCSVEDFGVISSDLCFGLLCDICTVVFGLVGLIFDVLGTFSRSYYLVFS